MAVVSTFWDDVIVLIIGVGMVILIEVTIVGLGYTLVVKICLWFIKVTSRKPQQHRVYPECSLPQEHLVYPECSLPQEHLVYPECSLPGEQIYPECSLDEEDLVYPECSLPPVVPKNQRQGIYTVSPKEKKCLIIQREQQWEFGFSLLKGSINIIPVIGFDCEWVSVNGKRNKVALLQIASVDGLCLLVRLNFWKSNFPRSLVDLLKDETIVKAGVAIKEDSIYLAQDYGLRVNKCIDLRHMSRLCQGDTLKRCGLSGLAKYYLNLDVDKDWHVSCSNWEADQLTNKQIEYAANDALIGALLYRKLCMLMFQPLHCESRDMYWRRVTRFRWDTLNEED